MCVNRRTNIWLLLLRLLATSWMCTATAVNEDGGSGLKETTMVYGYWPNYPDVTSLTTSFTIRHDRVVLQLSKTPQRAPDVQDVFFLPSVQGPMTYTENGVTMANMTVQSRGAVVALEGWFRHSDRLYSIRPALHQHCEPAERTHIQGLCHNIRPFRTPARAPVELYMDPSSVVSREWAAESRQRLVAGRQERGSSRQYLSRQKRQTKPTRLNVELYFIVDYFAYAYWMEYLGEFRPNLSKAEKEKMIRNMYYLRSEGVNYRLEGLLDAGLNLTVSVTGVYLSKTYQQSPWVTQAGNDSLDIENSRLAITQWIEAKIENGTVPQADHYMAVTRYEVGNHNGSVCMNDSVTFIRENFDFIIEAVMTKRIARSLGARYDELENGCVDRGFIMSDSLRPMPGDQGDNPWLFSDCSLSEITLYVQHVHNLPAGTGDSIACLTVRGNTGQDKAFELSTLPGDYLHGDEQCHMMTGWSDSHVCRERFNLTYNAVCTDMPCRVQSPDADCESFIPAEGTPCGRDKWCQGGECRWVAPEDEQWTSSQGYCTFGDQPDVNCSLTASAADDCYNEPLRSQCCMYCHPIVCAVVDRINSCQTAACSTYDADRQDLCCLTCNGLSVTSTTTDPFTTTGTGAGQCQGPDLLPCNDVVGSDCYQQQTLNDCCQTCNSYRTGLQDCPFGDRSLCDNANAYQCYNSNFRRDCCQTCRGFETNIAGCPYGDRTPIACNAVQAADCYTGGTEGDCCRTCQDFQTDIPGCKYGDESPTQCDGLQAFSCYDPPTANTCCETCDSFRTNTQTCLYGDRVDTCDSADCGVYQGGALDDCCATCPQSPTTNPSPEGTPAKDWLVPLAAGLGGVLVLVLIVVAVYCVRRRRKRPRTMSTHEAQMYTEYKINSKMNKRPPVPQPRDSQNGPPRPLVRQDTGTYAYINPMDIESRPDGNATKRLSEEVQPRGGNDPLPPTPEDYLELSAPDKYGYVEPQDNRKSGKDYNLQHSDQTNGDPRYQALHKDRGSHNYATHNQ